MKLLSICVPTYNRPDKLKELNQTFLRLALNEYGDQIEVIVRDNSDDKIASINRSLLDPEVRYYKNETNVGFCGSQIRLVGDANGQFIWIISDDDPILWEGFKHLMDCLPKAYEEGIDCINLPFNYRNNLGELIEYKEGVRKDIDLRTYVTTLPVIPFGYFASAVIRLNKKRLDWVAAEFHGNEVINVPLFLSMLKPESKLRFLDTPILEYQEGYFVRGFVPLNYYYWARELITFLEKEYGVNGAPLRDYLYKEFLLMMIVHRVGLRVYHNVDKTRWTLLAKLGQNLNLKSFVLAIMVALPRSLVSPVYLFYLSLQHARPNGHISIREVILRYRVLRNYIRTKQNERISLK